jgi:hypothetical protein
MKYIISVRGTFGGEISEVYESCDVESAIERFITKEYYGKPLGCGMYKVSVLVGDTKYTGQYREAGVYMVELRSRVRIRRYK